MTPRQAGTPRGLISVDEGPRPATRRARDARRPGARGDRRGSRARAGPLQSIEPRCGVAGTTRQAPLGGVHPALSPEGGRPRPEEDPGRGTWAHRTSHRVSAGDGSGALWCATHGLASRLLEAPRRGPSGRLSSHRRRRLGPRHRSPKGRLRHGSTVVVRGEVGGSVRAAGATVTVHGKVGGDIIATTGDLTILGTGRVGRDVFVQSGTLTMAGAIGRDLQAGGGMATLDGRVGHDVYAELASLRLTDRAVVDGSVFYTSEREATVAAGARIGGSVQARPPGPAPPPGPPGPP